MALSKGEKKMFEWLRTQKAGVVVPYEEVTGVTGWNKVSLKTYLTKRKLAPFLQKLQDQKLKVLMDGTDITEAFFHETFTQTGPQNVPVSAGDVLTGELGEYELLEPIGSGAVAHVWSAKSKSDGTLVASKIMMPTLDLLQASVLPNVRDRFRREARNGKTLSHPNIVRYLDLGNVEKIPFLIMELAQGSVAKRIHDLLRLADHDAAKIVDCCLDGLDYLHGKGSPHRDVKPANLLEFADVVKLGDLGIVRWSDFDPAFTSGGTTTRHSVQLGSWFYMAPEQQESPHNAVPASDIYSLAVTWIEMLVGTLPSPQAIGAAAYKLPPTQSGIAELIKRMHSYNPSERPPITEIRETIRTSYR
ncbi:MAG: eukaryotic-like serine/threonine-protein kinase [Blastocatellia bacterium]|jgi:serine/threonine protein kinase|nr:eukaryotic-like serine/threonine-protein kinase [Blastocatellia bacterium]